MNKDNIKTAIGKARRGIERYLEIMALFYNTDVSQDEYFQKKFNGFYRIRQRSADWYATYYNYLEEQKNKAPNFGQVLTYFNDKLRRYEPSFSSKFIATHDPNMPVWDSFVLRNANIEPPYYSSKAKFINAIQVYARLEKWYLDLLSSSQGNLMISIFDNTVPEANIIAPLKKIDFILWQNRAQQNHPADRE
jgi:hypothetical protein